MNHEFYMKRALQLAEMGWGYTNPNPLVGAVVVNDNKIIAEGYHAKLGGDHAEIAAFHNTSSDVRGATLYVNLEPCSHYGLTAPCAETIIREGIREVIVSMADPNPKVAGQGIKMLMEAGICVTTGVLESEAKKLNEIFIKYITTNTPFVIMKTAMTLDGKIASVTGDSKWITSETSRHNVHRLRQRVSAIMVGSGTIHKDNPALTTRLPSGHGKDPIRIIIDSRGSIPLKCQAVSGISNAKVILATTNHIRPVKEARFAKKGVHVIKVDSLDGHVDLKKLMRDLRAFEVDSILLEGGGGLNAAALNAGIVDKVLIYIAPKIIGGKNAVTPVEGQGIPFIQGAIPVNNINVSQSGQDVLIEGYIE